MATISVPRKVRASGKVRVKESVQEVASAINMAKRERLEVVVLTEVDGTKHGKIFAIQHSLIQSVH